MKKIFLTVLSVATLSISVYAQKKSGAIQFETTIDPVAMAEASGRQLSDDMKARMPKSMKTNYELLYNATNASYTAVEEAEDSNSGGGGRPGGGRMMMRFGGGGKDLYFTFADKKVVEVFDLMDTTYVMPTQLLATIPVPEQRNNNQNPTNGNTREVSAVEFLPGPPTIDIIKSDETKKIVNLNCNKVTIKSTRKAKVLGMDKDVVEEIVLWYTKDLGFDFSPDANLWTEGTVLAIERRGGGTIAKSIEYRGVNSKDVSVPKRAVAITAEERQAKMNAMMNRFRNNNRQGGATGNIRL